MILRAYGAEIDNIAKLIIKVKTTPFTKDKLDEIANEFIRLLQHRYKPRNLKDFLALII